MGEAISLAHPDRVCAEVDRGGLAVLDIDAPPLPVRGGAV